MDALVPAFIAALIAQFSDAGPRLAAILADRYGARWKVVVGFMLAHAAGFAIAAAGAGLIAPMLNPDARALFVALALLFAACGMLWREPKLDRLEGWRIGALATSLLGAFILAFGDRTQFLAFALSVRTSSPGFAAFGALAGTMVVTFAAAAMGEEAWRALPHKAIRIASAAAFAILGVVMALGAWRLI